MNYEFNMGVVVVFVVIVVFILGFSFFLGVWVKLVKGFFVVGGGIFWFVNGVVFVGDYLLVVFFFGICGMIVFFGYDGFLYLIGYFVGWIVVLFVVVELLKCLGKFMFVDVFDKKFNFKVVKFIVVISMLVVSIFYLIF